MSRNCSPRMARVRHRMCALTVIRFERLDRLGARDACLRHHEVHVLGFDTCFVNLAALVELLDRGLIGRLGQTWRLDNLWRLELLRGRRLRLRAQILDLGLAEDDVRVRSRRPAHSFWGEEGQNGFGQIFTGPSYALEDVGFRDHEQNVLALLNGHAHDPWHWFHAKLLHRLPRLLLAA